MAERELAIVIRAKDLASKAIAGVNKKLNTIGSHAQRGLKNAANNIGRAIQIAGAAAIGGLAYSVKVAGDFEASMRTINTVAQETGDAFSGNLGKIGDAIRKMARDTGTPLDDLTAAYYDLVSAGIAASDAQSVLEASNKLAIGGLATTAETVDLLTTAINSYGGDASKAALYADQFAVAIERGKVTAAEIAAGFATVGPLAANMGVEIDEISAVLAQMTAKGVPAAEVFTQMRAAMVALQRQTPDLKRVLAELGIENVEAEVASRGLVPVWNDLAKKADELGIPLIKLTGRVEGTMFALGNAGDEFESFNGHLDAVRKGTGAAQRQMEERQQGLNFQLARMRAILTDVGITLGSKLLPKIVPLLQRLAETIEKNQDKIARFADDVAEGFEKAVKWAMSLDWAAIGNSLKMAADFSRGLVEAFLSMPDWVKQAVITGWGLNKLTGGALGSIAGSVTGGIAKAIGTALLQKIGLMNVRAGVVNVSGGVAGGPGGVAGGGKGGLLGNLLKFAGVGLLAEGARQASPHVTGAGQTLHTELGLDADWNPLAGIGPRDLSWPFGTKDIPDWVRDSPLSGVLGYDDVPREGSGRTAGGSFGPKGADAAGADSVLLARFAPKLDKLATNEVIEHLARTNEMGLKGVGTSFQIGLANGLDPLGNTATRILERAEDPKAPAVMSEIQGHIAGLEEIQRTYLAQGDVSLAAKVQDNINTLHGLIGTTDQQNAIIERQRAEAASADAAMLGSVERVKGEVAAKGAAQLATQSQALAAVRATHGPLSTIAAKDLSVTFNPHINNFISVHEWNRTVQSSQRAYYDNSAGR